MPHIDPPIEPQLVFWLAMLTAVATGLGALPFVFVKYLPRRLLGISNAIAAGLMLAASIALVYEAIPFGTALLILGFASGVLFIWISHRWVERFKDLRLGGLRGLNARKAILLLVVMTLHSFTEGIGVGVSFGDGMALGWVITIAIAIHNIPEGLAISLVLIPRGMSTGQAALWCIFSSIPQPFMAVPAFLFVETFTRYLPAGLGFAAGAMTWMVFSELLPEARENTTNVDVLLAALISIAVMLAFQYVLSGIF